MEKSIMLYVKEVTPVVDRVGSGDAFMGGLIYGLLEFQNNNQRALDSCSCSLLFKTYHRR
jgi:sugar/nucleoside kinase (ribokinase family)